MSSRLRVLGMLCGVAVVFSIWQQIAPSLQDAYPIGAYVPSHFLAGVCLGILGGYISLGIRASYPLTFVLSGVLCIGVAWEILEHIYAISFSNIDTGFDVVVDLVGGYAGYVLARVHFS
jgi:hypothetical protein